jgi:hypothetical protein
MVRMDGSVALRAALILAASLVVLALLPGAARAGACSVAA